MQVHLPYNISKLETILGLANDMEQLLQRLSPPHAITVATSRDDRSDNVSGGCGVVCGVAGWASHVRALHVMRTSLDVMACVLCQASLAPSSFPFILPPLFLLDPPPSTTTTSSLHPPPPYLLLGDLAPSLKTLRMVAMGQLAHTHCQATAFENHS